MKRNSSCAIPISTRNRMKKVAGIPSFRGFCSAVRQRLPQQAAPAPSETVASVLASTPGGSGIPSKLAFGLPLEEDLKAGAISNSIRAQWSNIPLQVRRTMDQAVSTSSKVPELSGEPRENALISQAMNVLALLGKGPADLQLHRKEYCADLALVPQQRGMKGAYHWPRMLIPRSVAARCREDLRVDPIDADRSVLLLDQVLDKTSIVLCFSGYDLSGLNTGVKAWKRAVGEMKDVQVLPIHFCQGWLSRRTHPLTRQILRTFRVEDAEKQDRMFVYRGKWHRDLVLDFHLYNKSLPSVLFMDKKGYVRWHAVGLPTDESVATMLPLLQKLVREKQ